MSEPTYTITLTESERAAMAKAIGGLVTKLINAPALIDSPSAGASTPPAAANSHPTGSAVARAILSPPAAAPAAIPIEQRDRWARDRKGHEVPWPTGCQEREVAIWKTEQTPKYLKVTWQAAGPNAHGYVDANCFDQKLWPWLTKAHAEGTTATLYIVPAKEGKYLNIVGIRA